MPVLGSATSLREVELKLLQFIPFLVDFVFLGGLRFLRIDSARISIVRVVWTEVQCVNDLNGKLVGFDVERTEHIWESPTNS